MRKLILYLVILNALSCISSIGANDKNDSWKDIMQELDRIIMQQLDQFESSLPVLSEVLDNFSTRTITLSGNVALTVVAHVIPFLKMSQTDSEPKISHVLTRQFLVNYPFSNSIREALYDSLWSFKDGFLFCLLLFDTSNNRERVIFLTAIYARQVYGLAYYGTQKLALAFLRKVHKAVI